jgi:sec-independent protein translocase protein TatA
MFNQFGVGEIVLILLVVLLLFGAKRLPETARGLGRSLRIFKAETKAMGDDDQPAQPEQPASRAPEVQTREIPAAPVDVPEVRPRVEPEHRDR